MNGRIHLAGRWWSLRKDQLDQMEASCQEEWELEVVEVHARRADVAGVAAHEPLEFAVLDPVARAGPPGVVHGRLVAVRGGPARRNDGRAGG